MQVATWNVNSVRARQERLLHWLRKNPVDVLCLQETKVIDNDFPYEEIQSAGYEALVHGQKTYNGVAILTRLPAKDLQKGFVDESADDLQARLIVATIHNIRMVCVYVPNGKELSSESFQYKLNWLKRLKTYLTRQVDASPQLPFLICGDFNVAPTDQDVFKPDDWKDSVLCHESIRDALRDLTNIGLIDIFRRLNPEVQAFSWWDYRMLAFPKNNGLRIDLILTNELLAKTCSEVKIDRDERKGEKPSDHVPVILTIES